MPRVTVIIATYNRSSVLPFSIGSVLRQSFTDWELLVVGDCCTDDSENVVRAFEAEYGETADGAQKIRWINLETNSGNQSAPNNEGVRQARGELIMYLGHDDLMLPHHLETMVATLDSSETGVSDDESSTRIDIAHALVSWIFPPESRDGSTFPPQICVTPSGVLHRRSMTQKLGGWRDYREIPLPPDADLWQRARDAKLRFAFVPRLGIIKFPATARRDIYKTNDCHEQRHYFQRIGDEPDFEATELARMLCEASNIFSNRRLRFHEQLGFLLFNEAPRRFRQRFKIYPKLQNGALIEKWRIQRGLEKKL